MQIVLIKQIIYLHYTWFQVFLPFLLYYFYLLEILEFCLVAWRLWSVNVSRCAPQIIESSTLPNIVAHQFTLSHRSSSMCLSYGNISSNGSYAASFSLTYNAAVYYPLLKVVAFHYLICTCYTFSEWMSSNIFNSQTKTSNGIIMLLKMLRLNLCWSRFPNTTVALSLFGILSRVHKLPAPKLNLCQAMQDWPMYSVENYSFFWSPFVF